MLEATSFLRLYASFRKSKIERAHVSAQHAQLLKLIGRAQNTKFGRMHGFGSIKNVADYQRLVPLRTYEDFWSTFWKPEFPKLTDCTWPGTVPFFAVSSGTTSGKTKYIPYTDEMRRSNTKAGFDMLTHHAINRPKSKIFGGKNFVLGGSTDLVEETKGIWSGDLSGITAKTLPWWVKPFYFPPADLALLKNWEEKVEILARASLTQDIRLFSGVPSWMLIFLNKALELKPSANGKVANLYPNLELVVHGGVNFIPYLHKFVDLLEGSHAELREVYPASEGFIAAADRGSGQGLRLITDHGIFYEFVPLEELGSPNPTRHWLQTIERDVNYAIVLTTCAGLWSYILGDTVRFIETNPARLLVTGRTSYFLSAFGEHLTDEEIEQAVTAAAKTTSADVTDYSIGPVYPETNGDLGGHLIVVEFASAPSSIEQFQSVFTKKLCELNEDYEAHYSNGYGLKAPIVKAMPPRFFADWMKSRGKLGGQNKVPRIISDEKLFLDLVSFSQRYS